MILRIIDPCDGGQLNSGATCFQQLSPNDRDAAIVWYLWKAAQACASYSSSLDVLLADASCFSQQSPAMLQAMDVLVAAEEADAAGADVEITLAEAEEGIKCLKDVPHSQIEALKIVLRCKLVSCVGGIII